MLRLHRSHATTSWERWILERQTLWNFLWTSSSVVSGIIHIGIALGACASRPRERIAAFISFAVSLDITRLQTTPEGCTSPHVGITLRVCVGPVWGIYYNIYLFYRRLGHPPQDCVLGARGSMVLGHSLCECLWEREHWVRLWECQCSLTLNPSQCSSDFACSLRTMRFLSASLSFPMMCDVVGTNSCSSF